MLYYLVLTVGLVKEKSENFDELEIRLQAPINHVKSMHFNRFCPAKRKMKENWMMICKIWRFQMMKRETGLHIVVKVLQSIIVQFQNLVVQ